jgi:hypothetical protein
VSVAPESVLAVVYQHERRHMESPLVIAHRLRALMWIGAVAAFAIVVTRGGAASDASDDATRALAMIEHASFDLNHHVEIQSGENSIGGSEPVFSDVSRVGEVWLLRQYEARLGLRRFGMVVRNRRVYFASIDPRLVLLGAECAECHPNGPRAITGRLLVGSEADRDAINSIVSNVHLALIYFPAFEPAPRLTAPLTLSPCAGCHDGRHREQLTDFNHRAIRYQVEHAQAPPHSLFTSDERLRVLDWLNHH